MKKFFLLISLSFISYNFIGQTVKFPVNENIIRELPEQVKVLGLGDPTHQESTITQYRIDLIKNLCLTRNFKIIALEGNLFELYQAHVAFIKDRDISHYEKAMYGMLNSSEMEELYQFVYDQNKQGNHIYIVGFDPSFSGKTYEDQIRSALENKNILSAGEKKDFFNALRKANITNLMALFRNNKKIKSKIVNYSRKILSDYEPQNIDEKFFEQALKNLKTYYSEEEISDKRDLVMAENIEFLRNTFPEEKIILFGSSTHLLKNQQEILNEFFQNQRTTTLGNELNKKYKDDYFFLGYTAISGRKSNIFNNEKKLDDLDSSSIEYKVNKEMTGVDSFINERSFPSNQNTSSRFLGYSFLNINSLWEVMDGLVLIKNVEPFKIKKI